LPLESFPAISNNTSSLSTVTPNQPLLNQAEILQILSIALFEQVPLQQVLTEIPMKNEDSQNHKQLSLFNL